ncbi:MAG: NAD(P)H-dependent FMN reductase [Salinirussus sp.]|jgi:NAD(P)H-dependent FMN reductase
MPPTVVAVCGSLRDASHTRTALEHALAAAAERGAETDLLDLRSYDLPVYDPDNGDDGDASAFRSAVRAADSVLLGSPMYHGSYSGSLKNALDYCGFEEFEDRTVGLLGVSGGSFPVTTLEHLRSVCRALNAWVLPHQAAIPEAGSQFEDGAFVDDSLAQRVTVLGERAVEYATITANPASFAGQQNAGADD